MSSGRRVRILLEWWDPAASEREAQEFLAHVARKLERLHPLAVAAVYVEANPPPDEIEGLPTTPMA